jgi:predicted phosphodiesterase
MITYAIISDVHSNLEALHTVLQKIDKEKVDRLLFLGDSVGYGPDPGECTDILKEKADIILAGNHDWAAVGKSDITYFNLFARAALEWTGDVLGKENIAFLKGLPLTEKLLSDSIFLVHATPREPEKWHYLSFDQGARLNFRYFEEKICFLGHSHVPFIVEHSPGEELKFVYDRVEIGENNRYIVNVGSVGQPRDGNPDAAYALLKGNTIEIKRVSYDIVLTQKKMMKAGLPEYLIDRLAVGR